MAKSLKGILSQKSEGYKIPKRVQDYIPVDEIYDDGIFRKGNIYSMCYLFTDINYHSAPEEEKESMFLKYKAILHSLDTEADAQITINNHKMNEKEFKGDVLLSRADDNLNEYRNEYNNILMKKAEASNNIIQEKYITVSIQRKDYNEAVIYFNRLTDNLSRQFATIKSDCTPLSVNERLQIFHDFYRNGEERYFSFDLNKAYLKGHDFKDYICPDNIERYDDYIKLGDKFARVLFLKEYANYISDSILSDLTSINRNLMLSVNIKPIPLDIATREVQNRLLGINTNITNYQRKQNENQNWSATVPFEMEQQREETQEFLNDLISRDQLMMFATITIVHMADSKEELDRDTEELQSIGRQHLCQIANLKFQQMDGLNTCLPFCQRHIKVVRTLTSEALTVFMPFNAQDIHHKNGIYYGQNADSGNMILVDRKKLLNGNSFILGVSGSGKSFTAKSEIAALVMDGDADIIIIDPEREYGPLVTALGGEIIDISSTSKNHINALDINADYGDDADAVAVKSEFVESLFDQMMGNMEISPQTKSIIDRCTTLVYKNYKKRGFTGTAPTLKDFRKILMEQPEPEAQDLALALELFTDGSLDTFSRKTNVDVNNRLICYDILELGKQLQPIGMLVILDSILNRISSNRANGKNTFIFIDEIYLLFQHEYAANFLFKLWKRVRKYGAFCTGITQNVDDLLQSHTARTMLANSEFVIMLNQASTDRNQLAELMNISDNQQVFITNVEAGKGLMKIGSSLVPFVNRYPKNTKLYGLMSTTVGE